MGRSSAGPGPGLGPAHPTRVPRVLVVDDEPANTTILERLLRQSGYPEVLATNDSGRALALYHEFRPDIVLLDLHMPDPDGYQILARIVAPDAADARPPVVVLTADATRPARERALGLGAADFLTKPLDHLEVLLRVRSHLATRFLELELRDRNADLERIVDERTASLRASMARLQATADERRRLAAALIGAQEVERARIAADVHDGSVQTLVALGLRVELVARAVADPQLRAQLAYLRGQIAGTLDDLRDLVFRLTPASLERDGLAAGLGEAIERLRDGAGPAIELEGVPAREPSPAVRVVVYRIAQEALVNAVKHAEARRIGVRVSAEDGGVRLDVVDDGRGFERSEDGSLSGTPGHLGLASMRQRAELAGGWLRVESPAGGGTAIRAWVPDEPADPAEE